MGFLLIPSSGYTCTIDYKKTTHSSNPRHKNIKDNDCCPTDSNEKKHHDNCNDHKCDHLCRCLSSVCSLSLTTPVDVSHKEYFFATEHKFGFKQNYYSSEFSPIWLPPKIG